MPLNNLAHEVGVEDLKMIDLNDGRFISLGTRLPVMESCLIWDGLTSRALGKERWVFHSSEFWFDS